MKLSRLRLKSFRRFTDLTIEGLPPSAKLIVLVGPNGAGKTSIFEAFNSFLSCTRQSSQGDADYHYKVGEQQNARRPILRSLPRNNSILSIPWDEVLQRVEIAFHDFQATRWASDCSIEQKRAFYIRSSYRNEADFAMTSLSQNNDEIGDAKRPMYLISQDSRVSDNYQKIVASAVNEIFDETADPKTTRLDIRNLLIGDVRDAMSRIFAHLNLVGIGDPLSQGTFFFQKGASSNWRYKNLSAGEKAAFDLIVDLVVKKRVFQNTVFCVDEPELHMHTQLQSSLLREMFNQISDSSQLWIATHSIGMMREAQLLSIAQPGSVCFLDFSKISPDQTSILRPSVPDRSFWRETFRVALDDLADLVAPSSIILCEGSRSRDGNFDARCFSTIFGHEHPETEFVSLGSATEVEKNSVIIKSVLADLLSTTNITKLIDRDDRTPAEIADALKQRTRVLSRRTIESYLFDFEVLHMFCDSIGRAEIKDLVDLRFKESLAESVNRGNPPDDMKSPGSMFYATIRKEFGLSGLGNDVRAFCRDTLAPLIRPGTRVYSELRRDIFGE